MRLLCRGLVSVLALAAVLIGGSVSAAQRTAPKLTAGERAAVKRGVNRGAREAKSANRRRASAGQRAARERSRRVFAGQSDALAVGIARSQLGVARRRWERPQRVVGRLDDRAAIVSRPGAKRAVALSSVPLWTKSAAGRSVPVDLSLEDSRGALAPAAPVVALRIARRAGGGVALGGFSFAPLRSAADATAVAFEDKAYFANTQKDTDFMVSAVPSGAEASWVLRSVDSPERLGLDVRLPRGASLIVDPDQPAGAAVKRDGQIISRIAPPAAVDADGEAVPASYDVAGSELRVNVAHRDRDVKYPILVDPYFAVIYGQGPNGNPNTFAGWSPMWNCGMLRFGSTSSAPQFAYFPAGGVTAGCYGRWRYFAPGSAYVFEADFANLNHWGSAGNGVWYGIINADGSVPAGGGTYANGNDPPFAPQPWYENAPLVGAAARVHDGL